MTQTLMLSEKDFKITAINMFKKTWEKQKDKSNQGMEIWYWKESNGLSRTEKYDV